VALEQELVIDPCLFDRLRAVCPRISHVDMQWKRGLAVNEMTQYRYDVVLHVEGGHRTVEGSLDLEPGDLLVVYSDGLVEARNAAEEDFGVERLRRLLPELRGLTAEAAGGRLLAEVDRFMGEERLHDDLSLVTVLGCSPATPTDSRP